MAATIDEMVEAHLLNVQRELETLNKRALEMQAESNRLQTYLKEGQDTLNERLGVEIVRQQPNQIGSVLGSTSTNSDKPF
jgi:hypothetical protein